MAILVGSVEVDIVPRTKGFARKVRSAVVGDARAIGAQVGAEIGAGINDGIKGRVRDPFAGIVRQARTTGSRAGGDFGGAFNEQVQSRVRAALASLPTPEIGVATSEAEQKLKDLRGDLERLNSQRIGVDVDAATAVAEIQRLQADLEALAAETPDVQVRVDTLAAKAQLGDLLTQLAALDGFDIDVGVDVDTDGAAAQGAAAGEVYAGAFSDTVQARVRAALKDLPTPRISVATSAADQKLRDLRERIEALGDAQIGVDLDATQARAEAESLAFQLSALARSHPNIQVRVDAGRAAAELAAIAAEVEALDGRDVDIDVDVNQRGEDLNTYVGRLQAIALAGAALGPAIVPAAAAATAALGAMGVAAVAAGAGVGVLALGLVGVIDAVQSTNEATKAAAQDATEYATAQTNAANAVKSAQQSVASAQIGLTNAIAAADSAAIRSAQAVTKARQSLQSAVAATALANRAAAQAYSDAEAAVARAVRNSAQAQTDLNTARETAKRQLEDLARQAKQGALDEKQGVLDVADAQDALNRARVDPKATKQSLAQAQLAYDKAVQNLDDIRARNSRNAQDKAKADAKGVAGSDAVTSAQQALADAVTAEADARRKAGEAQQNIDRTRIKGLQQVADAEQGVANALAAQQDQARNSATAITSAQASVEGSTRQLTAALAAQKTAAEKVSSAQEKAAESLAALSPAGVGFVDFINKTMRPAVGNLRKEAQDGLLPGVQAGLVALQPVMPVIADVVGKLATALGDLFTAGGQALASPFWVTFLQTVGAVAPVILGQMGTVFGNLAEAIANLFTAFAPFSVSFGEGLILLTDRFAAFTASLANSEGFQSFIAYVTQQGPPVLTLLGHLGLALIEIGKAAAPIGAVVVPLLTLLADVIRAIPTPILTAILTLFALYAVRLAAVKVATYASKVATNAWTIATTAAKVAQTLLTTEGRAWLAMQVRYAAALVILKTRTLAAAAATKAAWVAQKAQVFWTNAVTVASRAWAAIQAVVNAVLFANPIGIVVLAIVALVAIIVVVVKHWGFFSKAAGKAFDFVKGAVTGAIDFVKRHWKVILAVLGGPFVALPILIFSNFDKIVDFFKKAPGRIASAVKGLWDGIGNSFKETINKIIGWWNGLQFTIGGASIFGQTLPSVTIGTPDIPYLAAGGVVTSPTVAMIGEGGAEAVVPLGESRLLADMLGKATTLYGSTSPAAAGGVTVNQTINNPLPERVSQTGPAALRRAALALGG